MEEAITTVVEQQLKRPHNIYKVSYTQVKYHPMIKANLCRGVT